MTLQPTIPVTSAPREHEPRHRTHLRRLTALDFALPIALGLWIWSIAHISVGRLGGLGLVGAMPVTFFVAIALVLSSAAWWLTSTRYSAPRLAVHVLLLAFMLYGTAPLVYSEPRYAWLYKYVGVVQYVAVHGHVGSHIDIFQDWPGFFALAAWFDRIAGLSSPLAVAGWAQLLFGLLNCLVVAFVARVMNLTPRERWCAILLFASANWVAQDYFAPQAEGFVLTIGVLAIAVHWCQSDTVPRLLHRTAAWMRELLTKLSARLRPSLPIAPIESRQTALPSVALLITVIGVFAASVAVHQLSPYVVAVDLCVLTIVGRIRPIWLAPVLLAITLAYLAPHFQFLNQQYGLLSALGNVFANLQPVSAQSPQLSHDQQFIATASAVLSILIWALAALGISMRWRKGRPVMVLTLLAVSPILLVGILTYGGEIVLRIFLFSLPWSACLGASALLSLRARSFLVRWLPPAATLLVAAALFLPAYFGSDGFTQMSANDVATSTYLYEHARPGHILFLDSNFPSDLAANYPSFPTFTFLGSSDQHGPYPLNQEAVPSITITAEGESGPTRVVYFIIGEHMLHHALTYGYTDTRTLRPLEQALDRSPDWRLFYRQGGASVYEMELQYLPPGAQGYSYGPNYASGDVVATSGHRYTTIGTLAKAERLIRQGKTVYYEPSPGIFRPITSFGQLEQIQSPAATTIWALVR